MTLEGRFRGNLRRLGIARGSRCLVALSGGGDSVALLSLTAGVARELSLEVCAARVSHGIRAEEADAAEGELCRRICGLLRVPFADLRVEPGEIEMRGRGRGVEQAAREWRHRLLEDHRKSIAAQTVLFGHTADDQLETVLMRIFSGAGPEGLKGIPSRREQIRRPLIGETRETLRQWLLSRGVDWAEDATNDENTYRRNRIRNELLPLISDIVPGWTSALAVLGERSFETSEALHAFLDRDLPGTQSDNRCTWSRESWDQAPAYLRAMALWRGINGVEGSSESDRRIPWKTITAARAAVDRNRDWSGSGFSLIINGGGITLCPDGEGEGEGRVVLHRDEILNGLDIHLGHLRVICGPVEKGGASVFPVGSGDWPLIVTFRDSGDDLRVTSRRDGALITEKLSASESADADKEMIYIRIRSN